MKKFFAGFSFPHAARYRVWMLTPAALLVFLDQLFKWLTVRFLQEGQGVPLIEGVFELMYVKNPGAAFSILENKRLFFILLTAVVMGFLLLVILSGRYRRHMLLNISFVLVLAGGIGNLIDRCRFGYVIDYLYFKWINFPVFNFADCCLVVGAVLMLIFFFFIYEDTSVTKKTAKKAEDADDDRHMENS